MKTQNDEDLVEVNRKAFDKWKKMSDKVYILDVSSVNRVWSLLGEPLCYNFNI